MINLYSLQSDTYFAFGSPCSFLSRLQNKVVRRLSHCAALKIFTYRLNHITVFAKVVSKLDSLEKVNILTGDIIEGVLKGLTFDKPVIKKAIIE
jgi:hypothetical protein